MLMASDFRLMSSGILRLITRLILFLFRGVKCINPNNLKIVNFVSCFIPRIVNKVPSSHGRTVIFESYRNSHSLVPSISLNQAENNNVKIILKSNVNFTVSSVFLRFLKVLVVSELFLPLILTIFLIWTIRTLFITPVGILIPLMIHLTQFFSSTV